MTDLIKLTECLACGNTHLDPTLDLGQQPLANNYFKSPTSDAAVYPLAVNRCTNCFHLQLTHVVDPGIIYKDYAYVSGTSQTYVDYMQWFAKWVKEYSGFQYGSVLDIGCNDGSQLDAFGKIGFSTYGVDPAENIHPTSAAKGHQVVCGFWDENTITKLNGKRFELVVAQNSFAHNPDPVKFLKMLDPLMGRNSLFFIQTSQADMVHNGEFDTIYHEHVNFYNINSMSKLAERAGFHLIDVVKTPIHGTSYVFVLSKTKSRPNHIKNLIAMEADLLEKATYTHWVNRSIKIVSEFAARIHLFREQGYQIVGYGAAAKGNTLLNFAQIDLDYIIDDNPMKQGKYSPGRNIPIISMKDAMIRFGNDDQILFVPLAWNFYNEIKNKILNHRSNQSDVFLCYFPEVKVEQW
jgi:SAM-dependent methyltransferase